MTSEEWRKNTAKMLEIKKIVWAWLDHEISPAKAIEMLTRNLAEA